MVIAVAFRTGLNASRSINSETNTTTRIVPSIKSHQGCERSKIIEKPPIITNWP